MIVTPILPDVPLQPVPPRPNASTFSRALDDAGSALNRADAAEDRFAAHQGSLQDAVFERAQADVVLAIATAAAQRSAQAVQSVLNMQI
jgi:flagellar hook-basal body complex protein FliE